MAAHGKPCTHTFDKYPATHETPINFIDSIGFERSGDQVQELIRELEQMKKDCARAGSIENGQKKLAHMVWYVVEASQSRIQEHDYHVIEKVFGKDGYDVPVLIISTKNDIASKEQRDAIREVYETKGVGEHPPLKQLPQVVGFVEVIAKSKDKVSPDFCPDCGRDDIVNSKKKSTWHCEDCGCNGQLEHQSSNLDQVVGITHKHIPEYTRKSFAIAQNVVMSAKVPFVTGVIATHTATAFGVGWSPIPFSDAPILLGVQVSMVQSLAAIYGVSKHVKAVSFGGQIVAAATGWGIASGLKFIPGVGTIIGGAIDAGVASTITLTLGITYAHIFQQVALEIDSYWLPKDIEALIADKLSYENVIAVQNMLRKLVGKKKVKSPNSEMIEGLLQKADEESSS